MISGQAGHQKSATGSRCHASRTRNSSPKRPGRLVRYPKTPSLRRTTRNYLGGKGVWRNLFPQFIFVSFVCLSFAVFVCLFCPFLVLHRSIVHFATICVAPPASIDRAIALITSSGDWAVSTDGPSQRTRRACACVRASFCSVLFCSV